MERGRQWTIGAAGVAVLVLVTGLVLRDSDPKREATNVVTTPSSLESLQADPGETSAGDDSLANPLLPIDPVTVPESTAATLPLPSVPTIPLPSFTTTTTGVASTTATTTPVSFGEKGVWVVRVDGSSPLLVAKGMSAGVAAGGAWVAYLDGSMVKAAKRTDLRSAIVIATGVSGTAAQGLPISGGQRGVAFVQGDRVVLVDPAKPNEPLVSFDAPGVDAVAAEKDGEGRLAWADINGLHLGTPETVAPAEEVERGMLQIGHGYLAYLRDGEVTLRNGPRLAWGAIDRLHTGPAGLVAASDGRVRFWTAAGEERILVDQASLPVITSNRLVYASGTKSVVSVSHTGTGPKVVANVAAGLSIRGLDLLDDATLVVTVA